MFKYSQWHEAVNTFKFKGHLKKGHSVLIVLICKNIMFRNIANLTNL